MFLPPSVLDALQAALLRDGRAFLPEGLVAGTIVLLLLTRLAPALDRLHLGGPTLALVLAALGVSVAQWQGAFGPPPDPTATAFTGLLAYDSLTVYLRMLLLFFAALIVWLSLLTGIPDREDSADFYVLLLGGTLGMLLMASANHLLMVFIAVEMASLPSYALAGFLKGRRRGSEAALKYVVYGASASGLMLYGISLLAGKFGTGYLPDLAVAYAATLRLPAAGGFGVEPVVLLGTVLVMIGLGFKVAAVPFHFWCPDVFEGAAAEVAGFLSVASKAAALALTGRFLLVLAGPTAGEGPGLFGPALAFFAALTATFGNLAAYAQTNLKRLLAYSTIAHAGYMLMGLSTVSVDGTAAVLFYLVAYLFMNLGAFAVVALIRNRIGSEDLRDCRGLIERYPLLVVGLGVCLLSLLGIPPLAGFAGKFQVFASLFDAWRQHHQPGTFFDLGNLYFALLVVGGLNTVFSAFYYLKVLRVMVLDAPPEPAPAAPARSLTAGPAVFVTLLAGMVLAVGLAWGPLADAGARGAAGLRPMSRPIAQPVQLGAKLPENEL